MQGEMPCIGPLDEQGGIDDDAAKDISAFGITLTDGGPEQFQENRNQEVCAENSSHCPR